MKKLSHLEIQKIELNLLLEFDKFCRKNNLTYYLSGGTLLGAIRHKGFIPWDDDIDICMPRKDYEQLLKIFPQKYKQIYTLRTFERGNFYSPFAKLIDKRTQIISIFFNKMMDYSLWIDIFPVDGLPNSIILTKMIYEKASFYRKLLSLNFAKTNKSNSKIKMIFKPLARILAKFIGTSNCLKILNKLAKKYKYDTSNYVGCIVWGLYGIGERMKKSEFEKTVYVEFEGYKFPTFSCWDSYLKGVYGDYMKLPPLNKRKTHDMTAYIIEKKEVI